MVASELLETCAQHSVHPNPGKVRRGQGGGTAVLGDGVRVFKQFAWLEVDSDKIAFSRPTHQQVTPAVGQLNSQEKNYNDKHSKEIFRHKMDG